MLHPHIPEMKSFAKHLFATFLGLLMAIGLEQWRERRHERHVTEQATLQVEAELKTNLANARVVLGQVPEVKSNLQSISNDLRGLLANPAGRRTAPVPKMGHRIGASCTWVDGAWQNFKAMGVLKNMNPARALRWSTTYADMARCGAGLDQMALSQPTYLFLRHPAETWPTLNDAELNRLLDLVTAVQIRLQETQSMTAGIAEEIEADLKDSLTGH